MSDVSIHKLLFQTFQDIIIDGDLSVLGDNPEEAWQDVLEQYAEALGEKDEDGYIRSKRELLYYEMQRKLVDTLVQALRGKIFLKKWVKQLEKITRMKIDYSTEESLTLSLDECLDRTKGIIDVPHQQLKAKVESLEKKKTDDLKPTREFFAKVLINLHEFSNWNFDDKELTVYQYCELVRRYNQHREHLESARR